MTRAPTSHWSSFYIGRPWGRGGLTCWGLARQVYADELGIELPRFGAELWREIEPAEAREFDLVLFRCRGLETHVGLVAGRGLMLHAAKGAGSRIERTGTGHWAALHSRLLRYDPDGDVTFPCIRRCAEVPLGVSIEAAIGLVLPDLAASQREALRVTIGADEIPPQLWRSVRPKLWDIVEIHIVPQAGLLQTILTLVVAVGAIAISAGALAPAATAAGFGGYFAAGSVSAAIASGAFLVGGTLLISALFPPPKTQSQQVYAINGFQNQPNPDGAVPSLLGFSRVAPQYAALPFSEIVGDDRYVRALFLFGYGPLAISDVWIGLTPIADYLDVEINILAGYPDDPALSLYTGQVIEDSDNPADIVNGAQSIDPNTGILEAVAEPPVDRISASDVTRIELEFYFPGGLFRIDGNGDQQRTTVFITVSFRLSGTSTWTDIEMGFTNSNSRGFWRNYFYECPVRGQYEIKLVRTTHDDPIASNSGGYSSRMQLSAIRSYRPEAPIAYEQPVALIEARVKATGQLNGTIASLSALAKRICPDWDSGSGTWISRATQNPASLARYVLQGPENTAPQADGDLDLDDFAAWAEFCAAKGLAYNFFHDQASSRDDALGQVAAAGRALAHNRGDKWTVIVDQARTQFVDHISPRNSTNFRGDNANWTPPDAYSVPFPDETDDYAPARRIVPWPGFVGTPALIEELPLPGVTDPDQVWIETRWRQYQQIYRRDTYTVEQDFEHLCAQRGDGAYLAHDVLDRAQTHTRVRAVPAGSAPMATLQDPVTMAAGMTYQCRFRLADGSSLLRAVRTVPGESASILFSDAGALPEVGDLALFGRTGSVVRECVIKAIEIGKNLSATLTLVDNNPRIDSLTDAEVAPAWDGRAGGEVTPSTLAPGVPGITSVVSGEAAGQDPADYLTSGVLVVVSVAPSVGAGLAPAGQFEVDWKLHAGSVWSVLAAPAGQGGVQFQNYSGGPLIAPGDVIDVRARAIAAGGAPSAYGPTVTHTVAAGDTIIPAIASFSAVWDGTLWTFAWTLAPLDVGNPATLAGVEIRWAPGIVTDWSAMTPLGPPLPSSPATGAAPSGDVVSFAAAAVDVNGFAGTRTFDVETVLGDVFMFDDSGAFVVDDAAAPLMQ